jgi:cytochrome P450 family 135
VTPHAQTRRGSSVPGSRLPTLPQSVAFAFWPTALAHRWQRRFGDLFTVKLLPTGPFAYATHPDDARAVFAADPSRLRAGEANRLLEPVNGSRSVVVLDGEAHERARQLLLPLFRPARLKSHRPLIERVVEREIDSWPLERPFRLAPRMHDVALEVIARLTLGEDERALRDLRRILPALLKANTLTWLPGLGRDLGPLSPIGRMRRLTSQLDRVLFARIERRRRQGAGGETSLDQLLAARPDGRPLADEELRDHLATLLLSGHETTSSSLAWAMERLLRHPRVVERLREELLDGDETYLDAVVKEVLRSRPAVMDTGRVVAEETTLSGRGLPPGSLIRVAIYSIHQRPDLYRRPREFRPERFLDGEAAARDWMPFGGGARRCLGAALAMLEMKAVIAAVVRRTELRPSPRRPERPAFKPPHLTLGPSRGARAVLVRRLPGR